ncbi:MAG: hypothetical protein KAQ85_00655, partial [Thermodesulfovibrionia bacterium]|nr:hypothetical protein [Thermodesulfovibrionia bacterium]
SRIEDIEAECLVLRNKIETDREEQTETVKKIKKFKEELNQTETRKFVEFFNNRSKQVEINE